MFLLLSVSVCLSASFSPHPSLPPSLLPILTLSERVFSKFMLIVCILHSSCMPIRCWCFEFYSLVQMSSSPAPLSMSASPLFSPPPPSLSLFLSQALSVSVSLCLSICMSICLSLCLSVCPSLSLSVCLSTRLSLSLSVSAHLSLSLSHSLSLSALSLSLSLSVCLSLSLSLCLPSLSLSARLSVCLSLSARLSLSVCLSLTLSLSPPSLSLWVVLTLSLSLWAVLTLSLSLSEFCCQCILWFAKLSYSVCVSVWFCVYLWIHIFYAFQTIAHLMPRLSLSICFPTSSPSPLSLSPLSRCLPPFFSF